MKRLLLLIPLIGLIAIGAVVYAFLRPTAEASQPIEAIPLTANATATLNPTTTHPVAAESTATTAATETAAVTETPESTAEAAVPVGPMLFQIDPAQSEARFIIDEVLRGSPKTVVGTTNQVAGQIEIDRTATANSRIGVIQVNARTLTTDNDMRNRAIRNQILQTDAYEFITFTPKVLTGLPETVTPGTTFTFQVTGDLTIRDVTREVTFDAEVTPVSDAQINGLARTTQLYQDFGIRVPEVPSVTGLAETVILELQFVALAVQ